MPVKKKAAKKTVKKAVKKTVKKAVAPVPEKVEKPSDKPADKVEKPEDLEGGSSRFFKVVIDGGEPHGRFSGSKPKQAANKALTSIIKQREVNGQSAEGKIKFSIVECTRNSKRKEYNYIGERILLKEPMQVTIGEGPTAKIINYKYNNKVMKDKTPVNIVV